MDKDDYYFDYDLERMKVAVEGETFRVPEGMTVHEWLNWLKTVDLESEEV